MVKICLPKAIKKGVSKTNMPATKRMWKKSENIPETAVLLYTVSVAQTNRAPVLYREGCVLCKETNKLHKQ